MDMSRAQRQALKIEQLPATLGEAVEALKEDGYLCRALGCRFSEKYAEAKRAEWREYCRQVTGWEIDNYLYKI